MKVSIFSLPGYMLPYHRQPQRDISWHISAEQTSPPPYLFGVGEEGICAVTLSQFVYIHPRKPISEVLPKWLMKKVGCQLIGSLECIFNRIFFYFGLKVRRKLQILFGGTEANVPSCTVSDLKPFWNKLFLVIDVVILPKGCQVWLFQWILIFLLVI